MIFLHRLISCKNNFPTDIYSQDMASTRVLYHILQKRHLIVPNTPYYLNIVSNNKHSVWYSTKKSVTKVEFDDNNNQIQHSTAEKVKENAKSVGYLGVIIGGIGITAFMFYTLFSELFSSKSPYAVYSKARIRCMEHPKVIDLLGAPLKAYGEETRRGRRRHISHMYYIKEGIRYMRIRFYIEGTRRRGTVYAEVKEDESGKYEYTYLYVIVNHLGAIVIEDNQNNTKVYASQDIESNFTEFNV